MSKTKKKSTKFCCLALKGYQTAAESPLGIKGARKILKFIYATSK